MTFENENHNNKRQQDTGPTTTITKTSIHRYQINSLITITINPEYSSLVDPLTHLEYLSLKNSIKEDGLHYPITINEKGEVLDGHHRFKICKELDIPIKYDTKIFKDSIEEKKFVIDINDKRRQLCEFQRIENAYRREQIVETEKARDRQTQLAGTRLNKNTLAPFDAKVTHKKGEKGKVSEIIAKKAGSKPRTCERAKKIIEEGPEEVKEKLRNNKSSIFAEYEKIRKDQMRNELISQMNENIGNNNNNSLIKNVQLFNNDFTKINSETIADNSIQLILTDPPYSQEFLYLYENLARLAIRVLKPRGSLVTYVGNISLTEIIKIFDSQQPGLKFWWQFVVKHNGGHQRIHARGVFARYKSLLWYVKGEKPNEFVISNNIGDFIESSPPSKRLHDWEQSPIESEYIIKNFTLENQTVLDPMMGSGTTGIAALKQKRKFIGIEIDPHTFEMARIRLLKYNSNRSQI